MSEPPTPTAATPDLNQARTASSEAVMFVGISFDHGLGPRIPLTKAGPSKAAAGNIFTISAPSSSASEISDADPHPGRYAMRRRLQKRATSGLTIGLTMKFAPASTNIAAVGAS